MKVYALKDKVAGKFVSTVICESDEMFVRQSLFSILMDYSINDVEYYCVGLFDDDLGIIRPCTPRLCSWDAYKFPVTRMDKEHFLTIDEIQKLAIKKRHEFFESQTNTLNDLEVRVKLLNEEIAKTNDKDKLKNLKIELDMTEKNIKAIRKNIKKGA